MNTVHSLSCVYHVGIGHKTRKNIRRHKDTLTMEGNGIEHNSNESG